MLFIVTSYPWVIDDARGGGILVIIFAFKFKLNVSHLVISLLNIRTY